MTLNEKKQSVQQQAAAAALLLPPTTTVLLAVVVVFMSRAGRPEMPWRMGSDWTKKGLRRV